MRGAAERPNAFGRGSPTGPNAGRLLSHNVALRGAIRQPAERAGVIEIKTQRANRQISWS
jgi:hypothetical protein